MSSRYETDFDSSEEKVGSGGEVDGKKQDGDLLARLYKLLRLEKLVGKEGEGLEKLEKEIEKTRGKEGTEVGELEGVLRQLQRRFQEEIEEISGRARKIEAGLVKGDDEAKAEAIGEFQKMVEEVGEEKVKEIMGEEWIEGLKKGKWEIERDKIVEVGRRVEGRETELEKKEGEVQGKEMEISGKLEKAKLDDLRGLVGSLRKEIPQILEEDELMMEDDELKEAVGLLVGGEASVWARLGEELERLPEAERWQRLREMRAYLEAVEDKMDELVIKQVGEIGEKVEGSVAVELRRGLTVEFYGGREARIKQLVHLMGEVGEDVWRGWNGKEILRSLVGGGDEAKLEEVWQKIQTEVKKEEKLRGVVNQERRYLEGRREWFEGRGRAVAVPVDMETGERLPFDEAEWRMMSDEERESFKKFWESLSREERERFAEARLMAKKMGDEDVRGVGREGALGVSMRRAGIDVGSPEFNQIRRKAREIVKSGQVEEEVLRLMRQIMNTGETSRSDANRNTVWYLYALLGEMRNAKLRDEVVVKLLWHDIELSMPGVGPLEDLVRMGKWTWYEAYDDFLDMSINLENVELEGKLGSREVVEALESLPEGSEDIWLGRILGAKTPKKVELEKRRLMLALTMEKQGFSYRFEGDRLIFWGRGSDKVLKELAPKFGLKKGGNGLIKALDSGLRGEKDVFVDGEFKWMVGSAISFEFLTLRAGALEGGREWRLMPNDIRKTHGYGQMEYNLKVDPRFPEFAEVFDLQFRSLPGWKFKNFLNVFEERLEEEGMDKKSRKKFLEFLIEISLTDETSQELVRIEKMRKELKGKEAREKALKELGEEFDWEKVLVAMGIEVMSGKSWEEYWEIFRNKYSWIRVVNFTSLKHTDKADFWKYAMASREAFGTVDIPLGDGVTPGLITQGVKIITGKIGLGNEVGREWGRKASAIYLDQSGGGWRLNRKVYRKSNGQYGLEQWRWRGEDGKEMAKEKKRAMEMGYELGPDGFVYDKLGRRVFRQDRKLFGETGFGEWGMAGEDFWRRFQMIDKWSRDGIYKGKKRRLAKWWLRVALWTGIEMEKMPESYLEIPQLMIQRLVHNPLVLFGLPYYLLRGLYWDVLMSDGASELGAASKPLLDWFNQSLSQQMGG